MAARPHDGARRLRVVDIRDQGDDEPPALVLSVVGLMAARALRER